jgi:uncharacterized protein YndB with AHSA1/START domain/uncharacterized protein YciI
MKPEFKQFHVSLLGTRPGWPENMTDEEQKIMTDHYHYLKDLVSKNKVILAGPCFEPVFGCIILQVESKEEAREIMDKEPSVTGGVHTYQLNPMRVSLLADNRPRDRYVDDPSDRVMQKEILVKTSLDEAWKTWTTTEGVKSFFSSEAMVELYPGGPFEIYFDHSAPYGLKGSEDCKILFYIPKEILCYEWNAPPAFGELRYIKTQVSLQFEEIATGNVKLTFAQYGWGKTEKWNELYDYFDRAWSMVLDNFKKLYE